MECNLQNNQQKTIPLLAITSPRVIEPTVQKEPISIDLSCCTKGLRGKNKQQGTYQLQKVPTSYSDAMNSLFSTITIDVNKEKNKKRRCVTLHSTSSMSSLYLHEFVIFNIKVN